MSSLGGDASRNLSPQSGCKNNNNNNNKKDSNETINIIRCRILRHLNNQYVYHRVIYGRGYNLIDWMKNML